ncbi:hypothetical protein [Microbacterium panaciterrae]|uniref:DNA polymerase III subunit gamma/tau n=1 Tax=Microbacterium panaciterrae TaxID=985759 RepID=A0ABP8PAV7_9MICO
MTSDPDEALRWDGDDPDPSSTPPSGPEPKEPSPAPEFAASPEAPAGPTAAAAAVRDADEEPAGIGNVALVFYGIVGGAYLLFAVGWAVGGLRLRPRASLLVADWMYLPWMWLAVLAPVLWFAAAWVLTRGRATWIRIVALIAGVVLLVPWPFVMFGTVGA